MTATLTPTIKALDRLPTPPDDRPHLTARPLLTMADVLTMGMIRDRQRAGFSTDQAPIDEAKQRRWWAEQHNRVNGWLFEDGAGNIVGYAALLQWPDARWVSSCAVLPEFTGHGYGKAMLTWMVMQVDHEVHARALVDNVAAVKLHDPLVWEELGGDETGCIYFRTRPRVRSARLLVNLDHCEVLGQ